MVWGSNLALSHLSFWVSTLYSYPAAAGRGRARRAGASSSTSATSYTSSTATSTTTGSSSAGCGPFGGGGGGALAAGGGGGAANSPWTALAGTHLSMPCLMTMSAGGSSPLSASALSLWAGNWPALL